MCWAEFQKTQEFGKEVKEVILSKEVSIVKVRTRKMINRGSCIKSLLKKIGFMKSCH